MTRLKSKLLSLNADKKDMDKVKIFSPKNCEELKIPFKADKTAKVVGRLAEIPPPTEPSDEAEDGKLVTGVLVQNDFKMSLMAPSDLREYAGLTTTTITCKQKLTLSAAGIDLIRWALEGTFGAIEDVSEQAEAAAEPNGEVVVNGDGATAKHEAADEEIERARRGAAFLIMGCVTVRWRDSGAVEIEWEGNMLNDGIADAVLAVLFSVESSPAAVKQSAAKHGHGPAHALPTRNLHADLTAAERLERVLMFLETQFGPDVTPIVEPKPAAAATQPTDELLVVDMDADMKEARQAAELARLQRLGIPVPGVRIGVDRHVARVWLETLEVECANRTLRDRVQAVVERAVETVAPLWVRRKAAV